MCISDFGDGDGDGGGDGGGGGGGGGSSPEAQFNKILHLNGTLFTQPTTLLLCRGTRSPSPFVFSLTYYAFSYQTTLPAAIIQRVAGSRLVPRSYSAYKSLPDGEN